MDKLTSLMYCFFVNNGTYNLVIVPNLCTRLGVKRKEKWFCKRCLLVVSVIYYFLV